MSASQLSRSAMVREFGGDPAATDSTRVLRLPGFVNRKYETEHVVRAQPRATQTYQLEDFRLRTYLHEAPAQYRPPEARSAPAGDLTQSERDWAFAKRLARGDDPEEIIRQIADYRGEEKHPSYARYTVEKAQATLQRKFGEMSSAGGETMQEIEPRRDPIEIP